jgi:hypothetical protein
MKFKIMRERGENHADDHFLCLYKRDQAEIWTYVASRHCENPVGAAELRELAAVIAKPQEEEVVEEFEL